MATFHAQHPTFHIQHLTPIISHPTLHTQHSQHPFPPAKYLCLSSAPAAQSVLLTSTPHGFCVDLWHLREKYSCAAWHIPHSAAPHAKDTFHILNTPPQIYTLFSVAPRPASKYAILSASLQPPDNQPFTIQAFPRHLTNAPFPTTKRHLSALDLCPFEAPSLTFRTSIPKPPQPETCPTPASPLVYALSTRPPFRLRTPQTAPPRPLFHPKFQPHISTKYLYPPPSVPTACMILWNVMG